MNIILFVHPSFLGSQSMPRFAKMLSEGMEALGHSVSTWSPEPFFFKLAPIQALKKWLGYIDQYLVFPFQVRKRLKFCDPDVLFVFADQALGPWVPLVRNRPHVIHCHDFLAQRSALGEIQENPTGWSGRLYQAFIRKGYKKGKNFISVSKKTREDLLAFLHTAPKCCEVVYNGLTQDFVPQDPTFSRQLLSEKKGINLTLGYLLHVGGNQWYKNRRGLLEIYNAWRAFPGNTLPLLLIGPKPGASLLAAYDKSPFQSDIHFLAGVEDELICPAYSGASALIFPSLAEGFGWPIAEAMASGCPVITTNEAPMSEVAGNAACLIGRRPQHVAEINGWANDAALKINELLGLSVEARQHFVQKGIVNAARFNTGQAIRAIEAIYNDIVSTKRNT
jgi:glycosyltransferase involved in cell wall biosynthesis